MRCPRRVDSSSSIAHLVIFDIQWDRSLKFHAKNSTYIYIYIYIHIYIYDPLDNRYGFLVQPKIDCNTFHNFFLMFEKKCFLNFSKVGRPVIGWRNGKSCCDLWIEGGRGFIGVPTSVLYTIEGTAYLCPNSSKTMLVEASQAEKIISYLALMADLLDMKCRLSLWKSNRVEHIYIGTPHSKR